MVEKKKKVVDKWKTKKWYTILAPASFDFKPIGEVVSSDENNLLNRVVRLSLSEIGISNPSSQIALFTNLSFRITSVSGSNANTKLIGHEIAPAFIKTFARRGKSLIHQVVDIKTKDNESVRLKLIAVTQSKVSENTRRNIRQALVDEVKKASADKTFDELMQDLIYGRFSSRLYNRLKQITEMRRVEVRKSERMEEFK